MTRVIGVVTLAACALAMPTAASATVGYDAGAILNPTGTAESKPQVAIDSQGDRHVVWYDGDFRVQTVEVEADGTLGAVRDLSPADKNAGYPQIAIDAQDRISVVWYVTDPAQNFRSYVQSRTIAADGTLGDIRTLSDVADNSYYPKVAVDSAGIATVVWENEIGAGHPGKIQMVRLAAATGAPLGPVVNLDNPGGTVGVRDSEIAIDGDDRATVAWARLDGDLVGNFRNATIRAVRIAADGTPGTIQHVSNEPSVASRYPRIAIGSDGVATIAWTGFGSPVRTMVNRLAADTGSAGTPQLVSDLTRTTWDEPAVAVDSQNRVTVGWFSYAAASGMQVETRRIAANGTLEAARAPVGSASGISLGRLAIASDSTDRVTVVWPGQEAAGQRLYAARLAADGTPSTTHRLSSPGTIDEILDVAIDAQDRASIVWTRNATAAIRRSLSPPDSPAPPNPRILAGPEEGSTIADTTPTFEFEADVVEAALDCKIDTGEWEPCGSPLTAPVLAVGSHTFAVRSTDVDGTDATPAARTFTVQPAPPVDPPQDPPAEPPTDADCEQAKAKLAKAKRKLKQAKRSGDRDRVRAAKKKVKKAKQAVAAAC